jgi:hypothetical protein
MNSLLKFLRRVRIHGGECGAVARALHHKVKTKSLPAVFENVSITTFERKQMTNKSTSFKRIALALVAALGFGALGSSQASAYVSNTSSITISSSSGSAAPGETLTATLTVTFTASGIANETMVIVSDSLAVSSTVFAGSTSDSVNVETGASATDSFAVLSAAAPGVLQMLLTPLHPTCPLLM